MTSFILESPLPFLQRSYIYCLSVGFRVTFQVRNYLLNFRSPVIRQEPWFYSWPDSEHPNEETKIGLSNMGKSMGRYWIAKFKAPFNSPSNKVSTSMECSAMSKRPFYFMTNQQIIPRDKRQILT